MKTVKNPIQINLKGKIPEEFSLDLMKIMLQGVIEGWAEVYPSDNYKKVMPIICDAIRPMLSQAGLNLMAAAIVELDKELKEARI